MGKTKKRAKPKPKSKRKPASAPRRSTGAERRADETLVASTLDLLRDHDRRLADARREVGAHVLESYFGGDEELARSSSPRKPKSYTLLAERAEEETSWSARDLSEAVRTELCARSLPGDLAARIDATYLLRLAAVDDRPQRVALAARIAAGELAGLEAKNAIAEAAAGGRRGGRKRQPDAVRFAAAVERALDRADEDTAFDAREIEEVEDREALARRLQVAADRIAHFAKRVRR
jgi:hypothetical protein